jgi:hypothetical protein
MIKEHSPVIVLILQDTIIFHILHTKLSVPYAVCIHALATHSTGDTHWCLQECFLLH